MDRAAAVAEDKLHDDDRARDTSAGERGQVGKVNRIAARAVWMDDVRTGADGPRAIRLIRLGHLDVRSTSWYYF